METDLQNLQQNHSNTQKHHKLSWKLVRHEILLASTSMAPPMALQSPTTPSYLDYKFVGPSRNNVYILKKKILRGIFTTQSMRISRDGFWMPLSLFAL